MSSFRHNSQLCARVWKRSWLMRCTQCLSTLNEPQQRNEPLPTIPPPRRPATRPPPCITMPRRSLRSRAQEALSRRVAGGSTRTLWTVGARERALARPTLAVQKTHLSHASLRPWCVVCTALLSVLVSLTAVYACGSAGLALPSPITAAGPCCEHLDG